MAENFVAGTYTSVKDESFLAYAKKLGVPDDEAKKVVGTHWKIRIEKCENKWIGLITCDELPHANQLDSWVEGVEKCVDHPMVGGKAKIIFRKSGDNCFKVCAKSEKFGEMEWTETYNEEGFIMETSVKGKGATFTEKWTRCVQIEGGYRCEKGENVEGFFRAMGFPEEMCKADMTDMCVFYQMCGDKIVMTEHFGKDKVVTRYALDEEVPYAWPNMPPKFNRKIMTTQIGVGKYLTICKGAAGEVEEWKSTYCSKGMMWEGLDRKSGQCCKMYMKRCGNVGGEFRMVATAGYDAFGAAMGLPSSMVDGMKNDRTATYKMCEKDGFVHFSYDSKYMPMDLHFKWNEEFEYQFPGTPIKYKLIYTKQGDCVMCVGRCDNHTMRNCVKFTPNFLIETAEILGSGVCSKTICERC